MTAPALKLTVTQRDRLRGLQWEERQIVQPGRIMLEKRGRVVGFGSLDELEKTKTIEAKADTVCLSPADFADVQAWLRKDAA
jgi:hypothetical protein